MSSSIPAAMEWLYDNIRELPAVQERKVAVNDGWPTLRGDQLIALGVTPEEEDSGAETRWAELTRDEYENVEVPNIVYVRRVGKDASKFARQEAFALLDAIRDLVKTDRGTLGGAILKGMGARVVRYGVSMTAEPKQAGEGRICEIQFIVGWQHRG